MLKRLYFGKILIPLLNRGPKWKMNANHKRNAIYISIHGFCITNALQPDGVTEMERGLPV